MTQGRGDWALRGIAWLLLIAMAGASIFVFDLVLQPWTSYILMGILVMVCVKLSFAAMDLRRQLAALKQRVDEMSQALDLRSKDASAITATTSDASSEGVPREGGE